MNLYIRNLASRYCWKYVLWLQLIYYKYSVNTSKELVVVLSPGKVGSSSVYNTLKKNLSNAYIFHVHFLDEKNINDGISLHKGSQRKSVPNHFIKSSVLRAVFLKKFSSVKFIVLFRDPVKRYISDAYQNSNRIVSKLGDNSNERIVQNIKKGLERMDHLRYLDGWISSELEKNLGYDFYKKSHLDKEDYYLDNLGKYDFLFMKMEALSRVFTEGTNAFFGSEMVIENYNVGENKKYHTYYKMARDNKTIAGFVDPKIKTFADLLKMYPPK